MDEFKKYISGKKITVMGLGLLGRGVGDVEFLAENGAELLVTDLKSEKELALSIAKLKKFKNIQYSLGGHKLEDFKGRDLIIKGGGVPLDSPYIAIAHSEKIPVAMSDALFARFSQGTIIGVTGTRGKTTVTNMIFKILEKSPKGAYLGGNIQGISTLALLPKVKHGNFVVMELDSWRLQGFGEAGISPHIAVFSTFFPDHLNYYKNDMDVYLSDKANIFLYQKQDDTLILGSQCAELIQKKYPSIKSKIVIPESNIPYSLKVPGEHNIYNASLAIAAVQELGIDEKIIKSVIESFTGVSGRLEYKKTYKGVKIYNDTTATSPVATIAALEALGKDKNIVLIMGGADKGIDMEELLEKIPKYCKAVVLLQGTGTDKIKSKVKSLRSKVIEAKDLEEAVRKALANAVDSDTILFSPAFASFGMFKNEYDRGEKFDEFVKNL